MIISCMPFMYGQFLVRSESPTLDGITDNELASSIQLGMKKVLVNFVKDTFKFRRGEELNSFP